MFNTTIQVPVRHAGRTTVRRHPWEDGWTRGEFHNAWSQTKEMTKEVFSEEIDQAKDHIRERHRDDEDT